MNLIQVLAYISTLIGFPKLVEYGSTPESKYFMVMSLHGEKVDSEKMKWGGKTDHNQVMSISQQVIRWLEKMHSIGYVHWDIKPHNILYTKSDEDQFEENEDEVEEKYTLIDFGIWSKYLDENGNHIKKECTNKFRGSIEFCAADVLAQYLPTRKHDLGIFHNFFISYAC